MTAAPVDPGSPLGLHRVAEPAGVLPQAAWRLDPRAAIWPDEVRVRVERLNLDAASYRQLHDAHEGDPGAMRSAVLAIVAERGKMQNPVTGSGGMLTGVVDQVGPASPLGLHPGERVATLVSLSLTPLAITDGLARWDARSEQVPCAGHAILFGRSIATVLPADLPGPLALAVLDVCGAPALTHRVTSSLAGPGGRRRSRSSAPRARAARCRRHRPGGRAPAGSSAWSGTSGRRPACERPAGTPRPWPTPWSSRTRGIRSGWPLPCRAAGGPADVTVVCVDVPGCEGGAVLATAEGGTVIFFSMATSFSAAALGAEGLAADVTMLIGNGYVPGHAELALGLIRDHPGVRSLFESRIRAEGGRP